METSKFRQAAQCVFSYHYQDGAGEEAERGLLSFTVCCRLVGLRFTYQKYKLRELQNLKLLIFERKGEIEATNQF